MQTPLISNFSNTKTWITFLFFNFFSSNLRCSSGVHRHTHTTNAAAKKAITRTKIKFFIFQLFEFPCRDETHQNAKRTVVSAATLTHIVRLYKEYLNVNATSLHTNKKNFFFHIIARPAVSKLASSHFLSKKLAKSRFHVKTSFLRLLVLERSSGTLRLDQHT